MVVLGIALMVAGAGMLIAEAHLPTYGVLGIGGVAALAAGAGIAVNDSGAGAALVIFVVAVVAVLAIVLAAVVLRQGLTVSHRRVATGPEALIGRVGVLRRAPAPIGQVFVDGALWRAEPDWQHVDPDHAELHAGDRVVVERVHGLTLCVRKAEDWELVR